MIVVDDIFDGWFRIDGGNGKWDESERRRMKNLEKKKMTD